MIEASAGAIDLELTANVNDDEGQRDHGCEADGQGRRGPGVAKDGRKQLRACEPGNEKQRVAEHAVHDFAPTRPRLTRLMAVTARSVAMVTGSMTQVITAVKPWSASCSAARNRM